MGRSSKDKGGVDADTPQLLWDPADLPTIAKAAEKNFRSLQHPLWTEQKARLIQEYLRLFTYITKHGVYIDGFAAPQQRELVDLCSAKLVLETEPKRIRDFWLCDKDPNGVRILQEIATANAEKGRRIEVKPGDFNSTVDDILASGRITNSKATFALLDQRTFECNWSTVERLSKHKSSMKIELFYFLASGWIDRSIAAVQAPETAAKVERWWGRSDWRDLRKVQGVERAKFVASRFKDELGYAYAYPFAIHSARRGGRTMYHMIHATDHPEASPLMIRAYRKVSGRPEIPDSERQIDFDAFWRDSHEED